MSSWPYIVEKDSPHGECRKGMRSSSLGVNGVLLKKIMDHDFSNLEILQVQSLFSPADGGFWAAWAGNLRLFGVSGPAGPFQKSKTFLINLIRLVWPEFSNSPDLLWRIRKLWPH